MKKIIFVMLFLLPTLSLAQSRGEFVLHEIEKVGDQRELSSEYEEAVLIWIYAPLSQIKNFKFQIALDWFNSEPPVYNETFSRWEFFVPKQLKQKVKIISTGYKEFDILIDGDFMGQSIWKYELREKSQSELDRIRLTINSDPSEATVLIKEGKTNTTINNITRYSTESLSGSVDIFVSKKDFISQDTTLQLEKGKDYTLNFKLDSAVNRVDISSDPSDAKLFFNNKEVSNPYLGYLPFGDYSLKLMKEDYEEIDSSFTVSKEKKFQTKFFMSKKMGAITFIKPQQQGTDVEIADLKGAEVKIGQEVVQVLNGTTLNKFPYGKHSLQVQKNNFATIEKLITIRSENESVDLDFKKDLTKSKRSTKGVLIGLGLGGVGAGLYLMQSANKSYEAYQKATSAAEASSLRKKVESADKMAPIAMGIGGLTAVFGITININK
jgi:hypothetical protein